MASLMPIARDERKIRVATALITIIVKTTVELLERTRKRVAVLIQKYIKIEFLISKHQTKTGQHLFFLQ